MKEGLYNQIEQLQNNIESNLNITGVIALEDELQDGIQETIKSLQDAGIKIWMITGDKGETAKNIAVLYFNYRLLLG